ncbi:hypothetical protein F5887DRAFT_1078396 [Amanita rubescens]|nr:hypothetical protein F5887DRAFT_1078396 [Amanita rubescens]
MVLTLRAMFSPSLLFGSFSTHSGDSSSCRIDDKIYGHYPNTNIDWLELRKEREEPQHEFIILRTNNDFYRIERRPPKGANIPSKLHGIKAEDTIIHLNHQDYEKVWESADIKIIVAFYHDLKPGLHSLFSLCDAIRVDPDAEKYTLAQFNCYFFARTLILLLTRHFLIRQYCNQGLPRNDFANLSGPDINVIVDQVMIRVMNIWLSQTVENRVGINDKPANPMLFGTLLLMDEASSIYRVPLQPSQALPIVTLRRPQVMSHLSLLSIAFRSSSASRSRDDSLLGMAFRSSSTSRSRDKSSLPIDDNIYQHCSNLVIISLRFVREREDPEHEFIILRTNASDYYRVERRPSKGTGISSKLRGCKAEDTITHLNGWQHTSVLRVVSSKIELHYRGNPKPDLHTVFDFCNAIRKDPETKKYSLAQFNCYFFARALMLLITRHFLIGQYSIHISPRNDFGSLPGPDIDAIVDESLKKVPPKSWIVMSFLDPRIKGNTYKDVRRYILEMNQKHCQRVTQFGGKGDVVYETLNKKTEEIWRRIHSDPIPSEKRADLDLALDSHATAQSDEDIKELLLSRAERSDDTSLSRLVEAL